MPVLVRPAEFALIKGVSKPTVSTAMKSRIAAAIVEKDGRRWLDRDLALELWDRNTKPNNNAKISATGQARNRRPAEPRPEPTPPPTTAAAAVAAAVMALRDDAIPGRDISEERKLHYQAELAKVQALQARQEVGSIDAMKREAFALAKAVREGVLGIIPRVSSDLAALADPFEIEQLLEAEVLTALRALADG
ncbi:MAG: hypothetical protein RLZZ32_1647 [Cyanobacteriota bacterium]|jgi:hypothetical protein